MRFRRRERFEYTDTPRKRAALARKQRLEREAFPLFADEIAAHQPDAGTVMVERAVRFANADQERRDWLARNWREGRRRLAAYPEPQRTLLRKYWQTCTWPPNPGYLHSMLHMYDTGRLALAVHAGAAA